MPKKIIAKNRGRHHLLFEGPELVGKSWLMSQVYDVLEARYNAGRVVLDGCHWFNSDVGVFGTEHSHFCLNRYAEMLKELKNKNVLFEKFHLSDIVYQRLHRRQEVNYRALEKKLVALNTKIILCVIKEDEQELAKRIADRLKLYPHYERILQKPSWYINQQREYLKEAAKTTLPVLRVDLTKLPNQSPVREIFKFINEPYL